MSPHQNGRRPGCDARKPALELAQVTKQFGDQLVVPGVSLRVDAGEILCLLGPSGCGKSTLSKISASLLPPDGGNVRVRGEMVTQPDADRILIFQEQDQIFPWMTVVQNVSFPLRRSGDARWRLTAADAIRSVGLMEAEDKYPHQLSGGMRQRVALARSLALRPAVLIMDEPFAHLDASLRRSLQDLLSTIVGEYEPAVLFVTHDIQEAVRLSDRIIIMSATGHFAGEHNVASKRPRDPGASQMTKLATELFQELARNDS